MQSKLIKALSKVVESDKLDPSLFTRKTTDDGFDDDNVEMPSSPPKILYHVTHKKNLESIMRQGLVPKIGSVTRSAHGDRDNPATPLVYLLDTIAPGILGSFKKDAIIIAVDPDPSKNDIWFFTGESLEQHYGNTWGETIEEGDFPIGIEAGDYYSESKVTPEAYYDYEGNEIDPKEYLKKDIKKKSKSSLDQWSGRWVHYSDVNKLGINPKQFHQDVMGIYFFPEEFKTSGTIWQKMKYKFTVDIKPEAKIFYLL
jgi:hypothetical protein